MQKIHRILSLDGGGVRGVMTARLLSRLHKEVPDILTKTQMMAGTSTGGIIALGLAAGLQPDDLVAMYRDRSRDIFESRGWFEYWGFRRAKYDNSNLYKVLHEIIGDKLRLGDLPKRVLIASFDLDKPSRTTSHGYAPKFFHNFTAPGSDDHERVIDVMMRTSAAPTYFPSHQGYIDGGVVANNPAMCALVKCGEAGTVRLLSIGTGETPVSIEGDRLDWGLASWGKRIINLLMDGTVSIANYQCRQLLGDRFHRLSRTMPDPIGLDEHQRVDELIEMADNTDISPTVEWLREGKEETP